MMIAPHVEVDDGKMFMVAPDLKKRSEILKVFPRIFDGSHIEDSRVRHEFVAEIKIEHPGKILMGIDGGTVWGFNPTLRSLPSFFSLYV